MSDFNTWMALRSAMQANNARRSVGRDTVRRVAQFARPHRRVIVAFLVLATVSAVLGVLSPILAGWAVDAIIKGASTSRVVGLALVIALVALADAGFGLWGRVKSSQLGEGVIFDLRSRVYQHVQAMPV